MVQQMWRAFLNLFGRQCVMPSIFLEHYLAWRNVVGSKRGRIMWRFTFMAGISSFWKNALCFDGCVSPVQVAVDRAKFLVAS